MNMNHKDFIINLEQYNRKNFQLIQHSDHCLQTVNSSEETIFETLLKAMKKIKNKKYFIQIKFYFQFIILLF